MLCRSARKRNQTTNRVMAAVRRYMVLTAFFVWTLVLLPAQILAVAIGWRWLAERVPLFYHNGVCRILRLTVEVRGERSQVRPTLYVCNHVSWVDIPVLAKVIPGSFVARHDMAGWPFFGMLAKLQRSVFIERKARRTKDHRDEMSRRLEGGDNLILFPEGTSSDGIRIQPFKSAFFSLAERKVDGQPLVVQPVSITFARLNNLPVGRRTMAYYAWVGDQDLVPHLWRFVGLGPTAVVVEFHPPVSITQFASRKELSSYCRELICQSVSNVLSGRVRPFRPPAFRENPHAHATIVAANAP